MKTANFQSKISAEYELIVMDIASTCFRLYYQAYSVGNPFHFTFTDSFYVNIAYRTPHNESPVSDDCADIKKSFQNKIILW